MPRGQKLEVIPCTQSPRELWQQLELKHDTLGLLFWPWRLQAAALHFFFFGQFPALFHSRLSCSDYLWPWQEWDFNASIVFDLELP